MIGMKSMNKKYDFSVITPFHNVELSMFEETVKCMVNQTIGFENIEWIVVMHNCEKHFIDGVKALVDRYENVKVKELNNSAHTPSSPRNFGLKEATSDYIGFLDADDSYRCNAIEKILYYLKTSDAQMVVFRREFELENPELVPFSETVSYNQTVEKIVFSKGDSINSRIYNDFPFFITSRAYDRRLIEKYNISFDETIEMGEDCFFNLEVMEKADRICYLPQFIGYHYFVNSGSILNKEKSDEQILSILDGCVKIINRALDCGLYSNVIIRSLAVALCKYLTFPSVSYSVREQIKNTMEPYLRMTSNVPDGRFPEPLNTQMNTLPEIVMLDIGKYKDASDYIDNGESRLIEILRNNNTTDYGKQYQFEDIMTKEGYQSRVPISDYDTYRPLIELQTNIGEKNIITNFPIAWYLKNSKGQLLPITDRQEVELIKAFRKMNIGAKNIFLWNEKSIQTTIYNDGVSSNNIWGVWCFGSAIYNLYHNREPKWFFTSPMEILFPVNEIDTRYIQALFALANADVNQISAPFNTDVISLFGFIERHWEQMCTDIENGTISGAVASELNESQSRLIPQYLKKDPKRADELRKVFAEGFDKPIASRIWKNLSCVVSVCTGKSREFTDDMKKYTGNIKQKNGYFASAIGIIGKGIDGTDFYKLVNKLNFYEFLPEDAECGAKPVFSDSLEIGKNYRLIVTTPAGLYRYKTNSIIKIESNENGDIIFSIV